MLDINAKLERSPKIVDNRFELKSDVKLFTCASWFVLGFLQAKSEFYILLTPAEGISCFDLWVNLKICSLSCFFNAITLYSGLHFLSFNFISHLHFYFHFYPQFRS